MDTINKDKSNLLYAFHKTSKLAVQKQNQTLFANQRKKENIMFIGEKKIARPFRWGIVGGGRTSGVGYKHRLGAMRDNTSFVLKAAAFDLDFARCVDFGKNLNMDEERLYPDYKTMFAEEAKREDGIEAVDIATPNFQHFEVCKAALEAGLHVICEKPLYFKKAPNTTNRKM